MESVDISFVVAIHGVERWLNECLSSLTGQSLNSIEVICVDDASPDASREIIDEFVAVDHRVSVVSHDESRKPGGARNSGAKKARGKYIWFVDGDDVVAPFAAAYIVDQMNREAATSFFFSPAYFEDGAQFVRFDYPLRADILEVLSGADMLLGCMREDMMRSFSWRMVIDTRYYSESGFEYAENLFFEDWFTLLLLVKQQRVLLCEVALYGYRQRSGSAVNNDSKVWSERFISSLHFHVNSGFLSRLLTSMSLERDELALAFVKKQIMTQLTFPTRLRALLKDISVEETGKALRLDMQIVERLNITKSDWVQLDTQLHQPRFRQSAGFYERTVVRSFGADIQTGVVERSRRSYARLLRLEKAKGYIYRTARALMPQIVSQLILKFQSRAEV